MAATLNWPETKLGLCLFDGYSIQPFDAALRTDMEAGNAWQRQTVTTVPKRIPAKWKWSQAQYALFEAWYELRGKFGGEWFNIRLLNGLGIVSHEARFVGKGETPYNAVPERGGLGVIWYVSAVLEVRKSPTLNLEALEVLEVEDLDGLEAAMAAFHIFLHTDLPAADL